MTGPVRVQLSRAKGWRMPPNTVKVDRSTKLLGNPYVHADPAKAVQAYRGVLEGDYSYMPGLALARTWRGGAVDRTRAQEIRNEVLGLRGMNLACWCDLDAPCHADVQLEWANR